MNIAINNEFKTNDLLIEIIATNGQVVSTETVSTSENISIQTSKLLEGFYTLRITGNQKSVIKKFVKI